jgi:glycosyltransferase involved in cell wall biosynthesis
MKNVAILLSTFNGEKYLKELLNSIINQTYIDFNIYIIDDGSTDSTISIIKFYVKLHKNIHLLEIGKPRKGAFYSFMALLNFVDADYYFFADQDDVWLKNKLKILVDRLVYLEKHFGQIPILVHSDLEVVDENLKLISSSFGSYSNINHEIFKKSKYFYSVTNSVVGCSMGINKFVKNLCLPVNSFATMHDSWITLSTAFNGGLIDYTSEKLVLYRQHGNNVIGANKANGIIYFASRVFRVDTLISSYKNKYVLTRSIDEKFNIFKFLYYKLFYLIFR